MPYYETRTGYYPESNPYNVGDKVIWNGLTLIVGDDFDELNRWADEESHIVTTCGRVLSIDSLNK